MKSKGVAKPEFKPTTAEQKPKRAVATPGDDSPTVIARPKIVAEAKLMLSNANVNMETTKQIYKSSKEVRVSSGDVLSKKGAQKQLNKVKSSEEELAAKPITPAPAKRCVSKTQLRHDAADSDESATSKPITPADIKKAASKPILKEDDAEFEVKSSKKSSAKASRTASKPALDDDAKPVTPALKKSQSKPSYQVTKFADEQEDEEDRPCTVASKPPSAKKQASRSQVITNEDDSNAGFIPPSAAAGVSPAVITNENSSAELQTRSGKSSRGIAKKASAVSVDEGLPKNPPLPTDEQDDEVEVEA
jgi:hypothetical protein